MNTAELTRSKRALDISIPLAVELALSGEADMHALVTSRLSRLVSDLGEDLGIRLQLALRIHPLPEADHNNGCSYRLKLNGTACDVERMQDNTHLARRDLVANSVFQTVIEHRSLLVTDPLVDAVFQYLQPDHGAAQGLEHRDEIRGILQFSLERWLDLQDALDLCGIALESQQQSDYALELAAARRSAQTVEVELGRELYDLAMRRAEDGASGNELRADSLASLMRDGLFYELGVLLPPLSFTYGENLEVAEFRIRINRVRGAPQCGIRAEETLVNDTVDRLRLINVDARAAVNPANGNEVAVISCEYAEICEQSGLTTWDAPAFMILSVSALLRQSAATLFTIAHAEHMLQQLDQAFPMAVYNVLERYPVLTVTRVLRNLVREEISIRDLRSILEALLEINGTIDVDHSRYIVSLPREYRPTISNRPGGGLEPADLTEAVRRALRRLITHKFSRGSGTLVVYLTDAALDARMVEASPLDEVERDQLATNIASELGTLPVMSQTPVLLTTESVRARLRREIENTLPRLAVLSFQELSPDINIQPIGRIAWEDTDNDESSTESPEPSV